MSEYPKGRPKARSPLGRFTAGFLSESQDTRLLAVELLGEARTDAILAKLCRIKLRCFSRGKVQLGATIHDSNATHIGRFFAYVATVLEQMGPESGRACGRALFQGRTRQWNKEKQALEYVPAKQAGGLAARLGLSPREIQRFAYVAEVLGLIERWQVKSKQAVEALPKRMRGKRWSYAIHRWCGDMPRNVVSKLQEWWRGKAPASTQALVYAAPPPRGTSVSLSSDAGLQQALSKLRGLFDPPS